MELEHKHEWHCALQSSLAASHQVQIWWAQTKMTIWLVFLLLTKFKWRICERELECSIILEATDQPSNRMGRHFTTSNNLGNGTFGVIIFCRYYYQNEESIFFIPVSLCSTFKFLICNNGLASDHVIFFLKKYGLIDDFAKITITTWLGIRRWPDFFKWKSKWPYWELGVLTYGWQSAGIWCKPFAEINFAGRFSFRTIA